MGLFNNILKSDESLFLNSFMLDYEYQPKLVLHRENEQQHIATCIKPLLNNRNGVNLLIHGTPGVGKTVCLKHVLSELKEHEDEISCIYINCWKKDTPHKIALEICEQIGYKWIHNKTTDELFKEITNILNKKTVVFVIDEADKITDMGAIYFIVEDIYKKTILFITNEISWLTKLDSRLKSRLVLEELEFKSYNFDQTKDILKQRIEYAFVRDVWDEDSFNLIAEKTYELKDMRTGLFLLRETGNVAEDKSSKKITLQHSQDAINRLSDFKTKSKEDLGEDASIILEIIKNHSGKTIKEIYDVYEKDGNKSYKTFKRRVDDLFKSKAINIKEGISDKGSKTSVLEFGSTPE
jgi:cell division control protein 6|tara:strand:- start:12028 stop:13083 length:1056 start_codon:yes stop_codon:yes gene_type:complete